MDLISKNLASIQAQMANDRQALSMIESAWAQQNASPIAATVEEPEQEALAEKEIANIAELIASILGGSLGTTDGSARVVVVGSGGEEQLLRQLQESAVERDDDESPIEMAPTNPALH